MVVVFTGGGTGGHLYPAIAIADAMRERDSGDEFAEIIFIGTADRLEVTIISMAGYRLETIGAQPFLGASLIARIRAMYVNAMGILRSISLLRRMYPDIVIATGGYVCFPVVVAARMLRSLRLLKAPIALLEPNAKPGLTNRILAPLVDEIWYAYEARAVEAPALPQKFVYTGVPVRSSLEKTKSISKEAARANLGLDT